jgi:hypothetical protein
MRKINLFAVLFLALLALNAFFVKDYLSAKHEFDAIKARFDSAVRVSDSLKDFDPMFEIQLTQTYEVYNDTAAIDFYNERLWPE